MRNTDPVVLSFDDELALARSLEHRLETGYAMIEERKAAGIDVTALEDFWIELLHEYEEVCHALELAA